MDSPERLRQIERLYHSAREHKESGQAAFLSEACAGDEALRREVESLLALSAEAEDFIEVPAMELAARELAGDAPAATSSGNAGTAGWLPSTIGHYRILRLLGEGGMGAVYEAEQQHPRRIVALKVVKPGLANAAMLRRFDQESQVLGRLQHPGIAQIYEAGTADSGLGPQPYFAMECIHGQSLRDYAEAHRLNARQRLELMVKICDAVQHAHQRGLIHRDLKPGNILVDDSGQPKILDFGIARVTDSDTQITMQTDLGQLLGTLAYMSPEQVLGDPLELDTRSDVYALGIIVYELLAGRLPHSLTGNPLEVMRTIRETNPQPLSSLNRLYRGDIETIVSKALEKDKAHRYASAADLGADIQHYLRDEPIAARPPSAGYQLKKFARRHRALVAGVAAVFVVLVGGIAATTWQAARATRAGQLALLDRDRAMAAEQTTRQERDRAIRAEQKTTEERNRAVAADAQAQTERNAAVAAKRRADTEAATAIAVNGFLQDDVLAQAGASAQSGPGIKPDPELKVRTALDRAAARIGNKFKAQPLVEASIRQTIGNAYSDLGLYPDAQRQLERALELRQSVLGREHPDTLNNIESLALLYMKEGKYTLAEPLHQKALEAQRRVLGDEHPDTLLTMQGLAYLYKLQGRYPLAEPLYTKGLEMQRRVHGEDHASTLSSLGLLAVLYLDEGKYAQSEPLFIRILTVQRRVQGEEHPDTLSTMSNLAVVYFKQGKYPQAEPLMREVLEVKLRVLGEEHPDTLISMSNLAVLYLDESKYAQAEPLLTKALEVKRRVLGEEHPTTLIGMANLANLYQHQGKYAQAESLLTKTLEVKRRVLGEEHPSTLIGMVNLGLVYQHQGKYGQAESLLTKALEVQRRKLGEEHPNTLAAMNILASLYRDQGKYEEAQLLYNTVLKLEPRVLGPQHPETLAMMNNVAVLYLSQAKYAQAEALLREALSSYQKVLPDAWERYHSESMLGASLAGQKKYAEAEPLAVSGYEGMLQRKATNPDEGRLKGEQALVWIVQLYRAWGNPEKATLWAQKLHKQP